ncbi:NADPH:quinone reductase [Actinoplanes sp. Pm04-4]|uniref:NADPH:quinone reductase n=1 Tax=Paractinoplanes pyxinae TaxID=2997416 RepID=A0ABT4ASN6_9ACTN|nr:NADPH:quinone reductase [Actinoplanes pyxinae]MCY1137253.1 NADPH:quinone reductase [Actinoplanes pyxinae]
MRAAWYDKQGPAAEVLRVGEMPVPQPAKGELRVRVHASGIHVGDIGKRQGWWGSTMPYPRVIPHGDGAGVVDAVGEGVDANRVGQRVWVYLAQSYRPFGTAAEYTVVPAAHAVPLPDDVPFTQAAGLGIPGITGHRAVFADGPVTGQRVLVTGALGAVGRAAVAVARRGGATVIATVRHPDQVEAALATGAHHVVDVSSEDLVEAVGEPVDRIAELAFDRNAGLDEKLLAYGGVIATYATTEAEPRIPYWPLAFKNITVRFLSNDDFPEDANDLAARDLTPALAAGDLRYPIAAELPLDEIVRAHELVENPATPGRVVLVL